MLPNFKDRKLLIPRKLGFKKTNVFFDVIAAFFDF